VIVEEGPMEIPDFKQKRKELKDTQLPGLCSSPPRLLQSASNVVGQVCKDNLLQEDTSKIMWFCTEFDKNKQSKGMECTANSTPNCKELTSSDFSRVQTLHSFGVGVHLAFASRHLSNKLLES
jgi:hypothetical protein